MCAAGLIYKLTDQAREREIATRLGDAWPGGWAVCRAPSARRAHAGLDERSAIRREDALRWMSWRS
jgi:hypothetical protein